jgi:hypothetical protein
MSDSDVPMYSDDSKYNPHDVLILKHFPDEDIAVLEHNKRYNAMYSIAQNREAFGSLPPRFPWPLPPPRPTDQLGPSIKAWQLRARDIIKERIKLYTTKIAVEHIFASDWETRTGSSTIQRTLRVAELLENILHFATPTAQLSSLQVSVLWRSTVQYLIGQAYRQPYPCQPVDHGDPVDPSLNWLRPSQDEIEDVSVEIAFRWSLASTDSSSMTGFSFPADWLSIPS